MLLDSALQRLKVSLRPMAAPSKRAPAGIVSGRRIRECPETSVGVSLLAIGCAAVVNPATAFLPDTPHSPGRSSECAQSKRAPTPATEASDRGWNDVDYARRARGVAEG